MKLGLALVLGLVFAMAMVACGEATPETVIVEKEVIREVPVEVVVKEEVIKEVEVPGETVVVEKEVIKEVEVPGETIVVTKEVPVEVEKEVVVVQTLEVVKEIPAPDKFGESPKLAALVRQGRLPPVEERLPVDPMVIPVVERIGEYGGEIKRSYLGSNLSCNFGRPIRDGLVRPSMDASAIVMAVAKSIEPSPDQKTWTVTLRTGMKWSDGHPFTADDFTVPARGAHERRRAHSCQGRLLPHGWYSRKRQEDRRHNGRVRLRDTELDLQRVQSRDGRRLWQARTRVQDPLRSGPLYEAVPPQARRRGRGRPREDGQGRRPCPDWKAFYRRQGHDPRRTPTGRPPGCWSSIRASPTSGSSATGTPTSTLWTRRVTSCPI